MARSRGEICLESPQEGRRAECAFMTMRPERLRIEELRASREARATEVKTFPTLRLFEPAFVSAQSPISSRPRDR